jgi:hypothetical protein
MSDLPFRLTIAPAVELGVDKSKEFFFKTKEELFAATNTAADLLLYLINDLDIMPDYSNIFDTEQYVGDYWEEVEEEDE